jgi:hypothetical protein
MPTRDEILETKTYKEIKEISNRVYTCLHVSPKNNITENKTLQDVIMENHRLKTMLSSLIKHLYNNGSIDEKTFDDILIDVVT